MKALLFICIAFLAASPGITSAESRPNILILLADDLKHHDLGITGCKDIPTPHIDALCASGTHFTQAYCTAPLCAPSRAGLLTGRNQARFGFYFNPEPYVAEDQGNRLQHPDRFNNGLPQGEKTLATYLTDAGYQTAWIGKWHLGEAEWAQPKNHGFDHCYGFLPGVQSYRPMTNLEAKRAGDTAPLNHCLLDNGKWVKNTSNITDMLGAEAARYISANKEKPWFMYCAFNAPHGPHQPDPEREIRFAHIENDARRKLAATISHLDDAVGVMMKSLADSGQRERTLVIFVNDHGLSSPGEWSGGKGTMMEGGLRSLMFLSWPGRIAAGAQRQDRVSFLDIAPTALAAAGLTVAETKLEGTDLLATASIPNRPLAWRMDEAFAFRDEGDWKLVGNAQRTSLYDLKTDPLEKRDLASSNPEKLAELTARWKKWDSENARPMWKAVSEGAKKPTGAENREKRETKKTPPQGSSNTPADTLASWDGASIAKHAPHSPLALDVTADFSFSVRFTLPSLADATLFEWSTPPEAKSARHFLALELIKPGNMPVPLLGAYFDGAFICGPADKLADGKIHSATFRRSSGKAQFFIDGVIQESAGGDNKAFNPNFDHIQRMAQKSDALITASGLVIGRDLRAKHPFTGQIEQLSFYNRSLADAEIAAACGKTAIVSDWKGFPGYYEIGGRFYDPKLTLTERFAALKRDYDAHYRRSLAENKYFPRVHVTEPGFITEPSTSFHAGTFHLWPHGHIEWGTNPTHLFQHLTSRDLVHWTYQPLPGWTYARACNIAVLPDGTGVTYANNAHRKNKDGTWSLALQKWTSTTPDHLLWKKEADIPLPTPPTGTPTLDHWIFKHDARWHMIAASPGTEPVPGKQPTLELYRAADEKLSSWTYVGPFYTGDRPAHHPKIFFIGGKAVIFSDIAIDKGSQYLLGRIENDRFIKESEGSFHLDETDANPFGGVITTDAGRNVLFFWMRDSLLHADYIARDAMREGWLSAYSLPRDITLAPDGRSLRFAPAAELSALRGNALHQSEQQTLTAKPAPLAFTQPHTGSIELATTLHLPPASTATLTLAAAADDKLVLTCTADGTLTLDLKNAKRASRNSPDKRPATGQVTLADQKLDLRVIYDHSLIEVYANGRCLSAWWRPDDPAAVQISAAAAKGSPPACQHRRLAARHHLERLRNTR